MIGLWLLGFVMEEPYPLYFGPWMLVGLIPLFIGMALLITYVVTRKEEATASERPSEEEAQATPPEAEAIGLSIQRPTACQI